MLKIILIALKLEISHCERVLVMQEKIEIIPALSVAYMRCTGPYGEQNHTLMERMKQWVSNQGLWTESGVIYGIAKDNPNTTPPDECRYDVCFVTESTFEDSSVQYGKVTNGEYLVFVVTHTSEDVQRFYASLNDMLSKGEFHFDNKRPILERYQFTLVDKGYCEFCIPIISS